MVTVTADETLQALLSKLTEPAEIRDATGKLIGYYTPAASPEATLYEQAAAHFDPQEMKRRKASSQKGYTTKEVLEHLDSLRPA